MGWCSGTEVMDTTIKAAVQVVAATWQMASGLDGARTPALANAMAADPTLEGRLDDVLRPFVRTLAGQLHDQDWDCESDSEYYERFMQEMLDQTDEEHLAYLVEMVADTEADPEWVARLAAHRARMRPAS